MKTLPIFCCEYNLNNQLIKFNKEYVKFFNLDNQQTKTSLEANAIFNNNSEIYNQIQDLEINDTKSMIIFKNHTMDTSVNNSSLCILYANIKRHENSYVVKIINWLNWLHNVHLANEDNYSFISELNNDKNVKSKFNQISALCCFKALYPLLMHVPSKYRSNSHAFYEIMRIFIDNPTSEIYSKDYARNTKSHLQTLLKRKLGNDKDLVDIIHNENLLSICHNGQIHMPATQVYEDLVYPIKENKLLNYFMDINAK